MSRDYPLNTPRHFGTSKAYNNVLEKTSMESLISKKTYEFQILAAMYHKGDHVSYIGRRK